MIWDAGGWWFVVSSRAVREVVEIGSRACASGDSLMQEMSLILKVLKCERPCGLILP